MAVQGQCMVGDFKTVFLRDLDLTLLDFSIEEFFDLAAIQADQMVMVRAFIQFEYRFAGFEMIALQQASLLELGQYAIYRCQTDIKIVAEQNLVDIFGAEVTYLGVLEDFKDFQTRQSCFQTAGFEFRWIIRSCSDKFRLSALSYSVLAQLLNQLKSLCECCPE